MRHKTFLSPDRRRMVTVYAMECSEGKPTDESAFEGEVIGHTYDLAIANAWLGGVDVAELPE